MTRIITVAAQLGLADAMDETPRSLADLASAIGADTAALHRLLYALASIGLVTISAPDQFALTPVGQPFYDYLDRHPVDGANVSPTMGEVTTVIVDVMLAAYGGLIQAPAPSTRLARPRQGALETGARSWRTGSLDPVWRSA